MVPEQAWHSTAQHSIVSTALHTHTRARAHNSVPHNDEADRLAKAGAQMLVVHKVQCCQRSTEGRQEGHKQKGDRKGASRKSSAEGVSSGR